MTWQQTEAAAWAAIPLSDVDGVPHALSEWLARGPLLLGIYKSSCAASKVMMPVLNRFRTAHDAAGLSTVGVAQDSANITRSFARRYGIEYPILLDKPGYPASLAFGITWTPTIFVIDRVGKITYSTSGFLRAQVDEIEQAVAAALGVPAVPIIGADEPDIPLFVPG